MLVAVEPCQFSICRCKIEIQAAVEQGWVVSRTVDGTQREAKRKTARDLLTCRLERGQIHRVTIHQRLCCRDDIGNACSRSVYPLGCGQYLLTACQGDRET